MISHTDKIAKAKKWATRIWADAISDWSERTAQDYSYREHVVEPAVSELLPKFNLNPSSMILEIGCGDGSHLLFWKQLLARNDLSAIKLLGVDLFESLIDTARLRFQGLSDVDLLVGDATDSNTASVLTGRFGRRPDLIVAMFLLQDTPDLEGFLNMARACLNDGGDLLIVMVHPSFAHSLYQLGHVKKAEDKYLAQEYIAHSGIVQWRFAGYYPIAQQNAPPFYLPYFHRNISDYLNALHEKQFAIVMKKDIMLASEIAGRLEEARIAPFYEREYNIYWPLIVKEPSSLLIHARKVVESGNN